MVETGSTPPRKEVAKTRAKRENAKAPMETETEARATRRISGPSQRMARRTAALAAKAEASLESEAGTAVLEMLRFANCISEESVKPARIAQEGIIPVSLLPMW